LIDRVRGKPRPSQGGGDSADGVAILFLTLLRRLLLLNVLPNHLNRRTATTSRKVAWRPKSATPQRCLNGRVMLTANHPTRYAFQAIHSIGNGYFGRIIHAQVNLERGQRLLACGEMGAVRPFCEAGTRRSEPGASLDAVGIPFLPALKSGSPSARGGEDVNVTVFNDGATWIESIIASVSENIQDGKHPKNRTSVQFFG
jgi:hypothetical protein